jgi:amino acid adenylation domain-containing protein
VSRGPSSVVEDFRVTGRESASLTVVSLLAAAVKQRPDQIAVRSDTESVHFGALDRRVGELAVSLRSRGVGPEVVVALAVRRGIDMVVAIHAVLRAGGAYVALDPSYPSKRVEFVLADSGARLVLGHRDLLAGLPDGHVAQLALEDVDPGDGGPVAIPQPALDDLAYVIYTSGSTGQPKGVAVTHRSLSLLVSAARQEFTPEEFSVCAATTSLSFDVSVFEIIVTLAAGGSIRIFENAFAVIAGDHTQDLTMLTVVPSAAAELVRRHALPPELKVLICGGEPFTRTLADAIFRDRPGLRVVNAYGPTEATVATTWAVLHEGEVGAPPIGRPLPHIRLYLLDELLQPVQAGEWGELVIAGPGLARGYLHQSAGAASAFLSGSPGTGPDQPIYRTGDLCRLRDDGQYEISGRKDQQVKVRGYRIEIAEVESALEALSQVQQAAVLAVSDTSGLASLVAVVVPADSSVEVEAVRAALAGGLPDWMIPSRFVLAEDLPHLPNGKVDRVALDQQVARERNRPREVGGPPATHLERQVAGLMAELVNLPAVGMEEDFFLDLGATSLHGVRLLTELHRATGELLPIQTLASTSTARAIAALLEGRGAQTPGPMVVLNPGAAHEQTLFLLAGWFGQTLGYRRLLRHLNLPDLPVIALCPQTTESGSELTTMAAMTDRSLALLRQQQPTGPYLLGGYSMGGMLAHEMGARLALAGEEVLPLVLLDSTARLTGARALLDEALHLGKGALPSAGRLSWREALAGLKARLARRRSRNAAGVALQEDVRARTRQAIGDAPVGALEHLENLDAANFHAVEGWRPSVSPLSAVLISTPESIGYRGRQDLGWRPFLRGGVRQVTFESRHLSMMLEPDVARLGKVVRSELQRILLRPHR